MLLCRHPRLICLFTVYVLLCGRGDYSAFGHGAVDELIRDLTVSIHQTPDDPGLYFRLSQAQYEHQDWVLAMNALAKVEELAPGKFTVDLTRGQIYLAQGKLVEAKDALDRCLVTFPGHAMVLICRARANEKLGRHEESLADYRLALANSKMPEPDLYLELADALTVDGYADEAMRVLSDGIERLGPSPVLVMRAMGLEVAEKHFDAALTRVDAMQAMSPRSEPWMAKRAALLEMAGRIDASRAEWAALATHLEALPNLERGSHSMLILAEQAQKNLNRLPSKTLSSISSPSKLP